MVRDLLSGVEVAKATIWRFYGEKNWLDGGKIKFDRLAPWVSGEMNANHLEQRDR